MKKFIIFLVAAGLMPTVCLASDYSNPVLDDSNAFVIARAVKLGKPSGISSSNCATSDCKEIVDDGYPDKNWDCTDNSRCSDNQKCYANSCVAVCEKTNCAGQCFPGTEPHTFVCGECSQDTDCATDKKCMGNQCVDVCTQPTGRPGMTMAPICAGKSCFANPEEPHRFICGECSQDTDCATDQKCMGNQCVDVCTQPTGRPGMALAPICAGKSCFANPEEPHRFICGECAQSSDCQAGYSCNLESKTCIAEDPCLNVTCSAGSKCSPLTGQCSSCPVGASDCGCPSGQVAKGYGGCKLPCEGVSCGNGKTCQNTEGKACCNCSSGMTLGSLNICAVPQVLEKTCAVRPSCTTGQQVSSDGCRCENCSINDKCSCPAGKVADGEGGCIFELNKLELSNSSCNGLSSVPTFCPAGTTKTSAGCCSNEYNTLSGSRKNLACLQCATNKVHYEDSF